MVGGVLTDLITDTVPQVRAISEVTSGAVENARLVGSGQSDMGFTIVKIARQAFRGEPPFNQAFFGPQNAVCQCRGGKASHGGVEGFPSRGYL